jgi:predicted  nucleic acid-binding Zn-ribbon protein
MDAKMPIQKLLDVQKVDLMIRDLETEAAAIPRQIKEWDSALNAENEELAELEAEIEEIKKEQRHLERQLDQKQLSLSKYNAQLPMIKTNREYKAILVEIDMVEKEISNIEEKVLMKMDEAERIGARAKKKEAEIRKAKEEIEKEKEMLRQRQKAVEDSLKGTRSQREDFVATVDNSLLSQYDRIRVRKGGVAVARILDESCGSCHMALPPQVVNEVIGGKIKSCPSCSRLLYWDED